MPFFMPFFMLFIAVAFLYAGGSYGGNAWVLAWPAAAFVVVALAYARIDARMLGKRPDGTLRGVVIAPLLPYFLLAWGVWHLKRLFYPERVWDEVAPGLFLGRRAYLGELPEKIGLVVDLTAELTEPADVRALGQYRCVATLDHEALSEDPLIEIVREVAATTERTYVHCALGHGRSALVAAGVLIARGLAADVDSAEKALKARRPLVRLSGPQRRMLARVLDRIRPPSTSPKPEA